MYSAPAREVDVVGSYDKTNDCCVPFVGERDSFYFTDLPVSSSIIFVSFLASGVCIFHFAICSLSALTSSFRFTLPPLLIYEVTGSSLFVMFLNPPGPSLFVPDLGL